MSKTRRDEILDNACQLFSTKGYHGTTIRDISEACGILAGSLYAHIKTKEDLLFEIADQGANAFLQALTPVQEKQITAAEKFRQGLIAHIRVVDENLAASTVFFHEWKALTKSRRQQIQNKRDKYEALWTSILQDGMSKGEFRQLNTKFARYLVLSVGNWLYEWYHPNGELGAEGIGDCFAEMLINGFKQPL